MPAIDSWVAALRVSPRLGHRRHRCPEDGLRHRHTVMAEQKAVWFSQLNTTGDLPFAQNKLFRKPGGEIVIAKRQAGKDPEEKRSRRRWYWL